MTKQRDFNMLVSWLPDDVNHPDAAPLAGPAEVGPRRRSRCVCGGFVYLDRWSNEYTDGLRFGRFDLPPSSSTPPVDHVMPPAIATQRLMSFGGS